MKLHVHSVYVLTHTYQIEMQQQQKLEIIYTMYVTIPVFNITHRDRRLFFFRTIWSAIAIATQNR